MDLKTTSDSNNFVDRYNAERVVFKCFRMLLRHVRDVEIALYGRDSNNLFDCGQQKVQCTV